MLDSQTLETIELLKQVKPLFESGTNTYFLVGGWVSALVVAYFPQVLLSRRQRHLQKVSTVLQLYSEISATLEVVQMRGYFETMHKIIHNFHEGYTFEIQVADENFPIYKANIQHLGLLPVDIQQRVIKVYTLMEAILQDIKPGGWLNASPPGKEAFIQVLSIMQEAKNEAEQFQAEVERDYVDHISSPSRRKQI